MFIVDNVLCILVIEAFLAVYLLDNGNKIYHGNENNIVEQWRVKENPIKKETSFTGNLFKKIPSFKAERPKDWKEKFTEFIDSTTVYTQTFLIGLALTTFLYLALRTFLSMLNSTLKSRSRQSALLMPGMFDGKSARTWLDNFEMYLDEENITKPSERCAALLSR